MLYFALQIHLAFEKKKIYICSISLLQIHLALEKKNKKKLGYTRYFISANYRTTQATIYLTVFRFCNKTLNQLEYALIKALAYAISPGQKRGYTA